MSEPASSSIDKDARIAELEAALAARDTLIDTLRHQLAQLRRMTFGQSSEKLALQIEQLELALEELEGEAEVADSRTTDTARAERVPVPPWLRKRIMARLVRDAHHYFFNLEFSPRPGTTYRVRDELRRRFISCLESGANNRPLVVVSHSMGTIIAYDCLANEPTCPPIDGLMTIGSPLGLDEVQDFFPNWTRESGFPSSKLHGPWVNVYDPLDIVCGADPRLANDFRRGSDILIDDIRQDNWGYWRHSISKYLQGSELRHWLVRMLDIES